MAQVWLVTGSSRGLGRAIVEAGLAAGNKVLATARDIKSLPDLSERYGDFEKRLASLKVELECKHEVPRILTAGDVAESVRGWVVEHIRCCEVGMVECVQEVGAKL